ncbi:YrdB family protein [Pseudonocardia humida]|uniref:YrdB family protein n=1 Tax=Pseudonocardia humida TaxID=2800819 RepID=A0ABT1A9N3_9PSEU|nr:YrdB family protein [Pseudonocardia humida]MCO1659745.1 YrdB family protein [Pseudonocardia humida]
MGGADLALRFGLELAALGGLAWSAARLTGGGRLAAVAAVAAPVAAAGAWGTFAVPGDPSRSGRAPVPVSGRVRLLVEAAVFGSAIAGTASAGAPAVAGALVTALAGHTALSIPRLRWLWRTRRPRPDDDPVVTSSGPPGRATSVQPSPAARLWSVTRIATRHCV